MRAVKIVQSIRRLQFEHAAVAELLGQVQHRTEYSRDEQPRTQPMTKPNVNRRGFLAMTGVALGASIAGCTGASAPTQDAETGHSPTPDRADLNENTTDIEQSPYTKVYEAIAPAVVEIRVTGDELVGGQGSGFVYDGETVLTNQHVVMEASEVDVGFRDGEWQSGTVLATDVHSDLAVVSIESAPDDLSPLEFVREAPAIGTEVVAIGSPFGLGGSASAGIVSGVNRSLPSPTGFSIPAAIQTDAAVNPGNSGGPLASLNGDIVGVIFAGGGDNIGFAISGALVERVVPTLEDGEQYEHSYMGIQLFDVSPTVADANDLDEARGVYVAEVVPESPADGVLQGATDETFVNGMPVPLGGDVIHAMDGVRIATVDDLSTFLALETHPGDTIEIEVSRDSERQHVELTLGVRPDSAN